MTQKSGGNGDKLWRYGWDYENRMSSAWNGKVRVRYLYDALGRRVARNAGLQGGTKFTYDGQDVILDQDADGNTVKYLNGQGIDNKLRQTVNGQASYFLADHLGSTNALIDASGTITSQTNYDAFGNQTATLATRYGYTGRERDDATGLMYYRARQYSPDLGRFISEDPKGFGGGDINQYGYVWNNAANLADPSGTDGCTKDRRGNCINEPPPPPFNGGEPHRRYVPWSGGIDPAPSPSPEFTPVPPELATPPTRATPPRSSNAESSCDCQTAIPRLPDFYTGGVYFPIPQTGGIVRVGGSITVDRHLQWYITPGVSVGFPPGLDASVTGGWLLQRCKPTPKQTEDYLTDFGGSFNGSLPNAIGGGIGVSSGGWAVTGGFGTPGGSFNGGYGIRFR